MNDPSGSNWRKWDLHVHTPASIVQEYGGNQEQIWERFIDELENLPSDIRVLGINDYIFVDGYQRLLEEKKSGRLQNIYLLLPVIELRLDKFGGSHSHFSRINFHVIFSDEITPEIIKAQFINALSTNYRLAPEYAQLESEWAAVPTRESLVELGTKIIESVPAERRSQFGSPLIEGFNNLNFQLDGIKDILNRPIFRGKYLTAVGKTEWADIKWNDHSIADKKNVINSAHFVFVAAENISGCQKAKKQLKDSEVNSRLLDCSDAHHFSDSKQKDRLGHCYTWFKADTTFEGLTQVYKEYEERVFLGAVPPKRQNVGSNRTKYIQSIRITRAEHSTLDDSEVWFHDIQLNLNHGLIAIIGNQGSGKSALTDVIGLLGNSHQDQNFSFLNTQRFKAERNNRAQHFEATIRWESGSEHTTQLHKTPDYTSGELVKYIPQNLFDKICNEIPYGKETNFDRELKKVIYSHVPTAERLGHNSLDEWITYKTNETYEAIEMLQSKVQGINQQIAMMEEKLLPEYKLQLEHALEQKRKELNAHEETKPEEVASPEAQPSSEIEALNEEIKAQEVEREKIRAKINDTKTDEEGAARLLSTADRVIERIKNFEQRFDSLRNDCAQELSSLGLSIDDVIRFSKNIEPIRSARENAAQMKSQASAALSAENPDSLKNMLRRIEHILEDLREKLDEPNQQYQRYQEQLRRWTEKRDEILGNPVKPDSIHYFEAQLKQLANLPAELANTKELRLSTVRQIYGHIKRLADTYRELYAPVQDFIDNHPLAKNKFALNFEVAIVNVDFHEKFFDWIGHNYAGSFYRAEQGKRILNEILQQHDFDTEEGMVAFLDDILDHLTHDKRDSSSKTVRISEQLRQGHTVESLYDYIFSLNYLRPRYILKLGSKELNFLSPGERGALLLIFYLLVDLDNTPIIVDQPEGNLDNQSVYELLVDAIKEAKKTRQVIIVTHNPNLAVVCDAEQIICCSHDKENGNRFEYITGSIENPRIKHRIIDVLEGTRPAFNSRKLVYDPLSWA